MLNIKVFTGELEDALKKVEILIPNKPKMEILNGVKLEVNKYDQLVIFSTDLENNIKVKLTPEIISKGSIVLSSIKDITKSIKFFTEKYTNLIQNDRNLEIINGDKRINVPLFETKEYPEEFKNNKGEVNTYKENKLYNRIQKVNYARSKDDTRPHLTGICFNKSDIITLDGYRMSLNSDNELYINNPFTIKDSTIKILQKTLNRRWEWGVEIMSNKKYVQFKYDNVELTSSLIEGDYFKYEEIIPKDPNSITINKKQLEDNLKFLYVHTKGTEYNLLKFKLNNDILKFENALGSVSTEINVKSNYEHFTGIDNKYLLDALKVIKEDDVNILFNSEFNPVSISIENELHLILPVRIGG